jgi:hypothetical protein
VGTGVMAVDYQSGVGVVAGLQTGLLALEVRVPFTNKTI